MMYNQLTPEQQQQFKKNEDNNLHSENVLLLAGATKNRFFINVAKGLLEEHNKLGYMPSELLSIRSALLQYMIFVKKEHVLSNNPQKNM